ncbi:hypothetical protein DUI87_31428 [Hirundo rustica rustica]|uniref:Uncharacterized protein n=1 Tax=Hirundo rustica rustica TaxID=333673 RepID=A0A3M0JC97_HIRRU|nr:hypothetical protein DUI87_31428 [Hirundo rustica rustica]
MMEPLGEEEERVLKEFEFDSGKLVGELGQDFEGLGALLDHTEELVTVGEDETGKPYKYDCLAKDSNSMKPMSEIEMKVNVEM